MADISMVDSISVFQRYVSTVGKPARNNNTHEEEWHGACPRCGGHDRFMFTNTGRFSCTIRSSGCGWHGDVITFIMELEHLSYPKACEELGVDPGSKFNGEAIEALKRHLRGNAEPPSPKWQEHAKLTIHQAQKVLWSKYGKDALQYLFSRGLTKDTIMQAEIGYIPLNKQGRWYSNPLDEWGLEDREDKKQVWLPEGILIPWRIAGDIWRLNVRRLTGLKPGDDKYLPVLGGSEGLYGADDIEPDVPLILSESELDALSGKQNANDIAVFCATGGITRARRDQWLARLSIAPCVLIATDRGDANGAGDDGAEALHKLLPANSIRWKPWSHDLNDMLREGKDIKAWVKLGVKNYQLAKNAPANNQDQVKEEETQAEKHDPTDLSQYASNCAVCWEDIDRSSREFYYDPTGILYCEQHVPEYLLVRIG